MRNWWHVSTSRTSFSTECLRQKLREIRYLTDVDSFIHEQTSPRKTVLFINTEYQEHALGISSSTKADLSYIALSWFVFAYGTMELWIWIHRCLDTPKLCPPTRTEPMKTVSTFCSSERRYLWQVISGKVHVWRCTFTEFIHFTGWRSHFIVKNYGVSVLGQCRLTERL